MKLPDAPESITCPGPTIVAVLEAAEAERDEARAEQERRREQREEERAKRADTMRATILDPNASVAFKLEAWSELRNVKPWGDDVVLEMIGIAESAEDAAIRADIWRQADGKDENTLLVPPLLSALANDPDAWVRAEAAETLQNYLAEPGVEPALRRAAEHDPSGEVREQAVESLSEG